MRRRLRLLLLSVLGLSLLLPASLLQAQEDGADDDAKGRMGIFMRLRASSLRVTNQSLFLAVRDEPGGTLQGDVVDAAWDQRISPSFTVGMVLPNQRDRFALTFDQFDETLDIGETGPFRNSWASLNAGFLEDLDGDGDVDGFECGTGTVPGGTVPCESDGQGDSVLDGAEDIDGDGQAGFVRFDTSDSLISEIQTEILTVDLEYSRPIKETRRFRLMGSAGLRFASLSQDMDLIYRDFGSFAAYIDSDDDSFFNPGGGQDPEGYDADGDGLDPDINGNNCTKDCTGDGWGDGNGSQIFDDLLNIPTVDEDRIQAKVEASGVGISLGLEGEYLFKGRRLRFQEKAGFERSWALVSSARLGIMSGDIDYELTETLVDERDALPNFFNWDFNGDGVFGEGPAGHDFDCNGDGLVTATDWNFGDCVGALAGINLGSYSLTGIRYIQDTINVSGSGYTTDPYGDGTLDQGDPIGEAERNTTIARTTTLVRDLEGSSSELITSLDLDLGVRWYFSRFADLAFGARASRWFDVGNLKNVSSETSAEALTNGDLTLTGAFVTLTVRPRF